MKEHRLKWFIIWWFIIWISVIAFRIVIDYSQTRCAQPKTTYPVLIHQDTTVVAERLAELKTK